MLPYQKMSRMFKILFCLCWESHAAIAAKSEPHGAPIITEQKYDRN